MAPTDNKARMVAKIRALLAKTEEAGATEAEAIAAAAKASELMTAYDITDEALRDVEAESERYGKRTVGAGEKRGHEAHRMCSLAIGAFCDCKVWASRDGGIVFFGAESDTELARYFLDLCRAAMDAEFLRYRRDSDGAAGVHGRTLRAAFMRGMGGRLSARFTAMKAERDRAVRATETGRALVIAKGAIVERKFRALGIHLRSRSSTSYIRHGGAYAAGQAAGDRTGLGMGVGARGASVRQIGR